MLMLTKEQANVIVKKLMEDIPYNINMMNSKGKIIASGDKSRIGTRHRGAERAIKERKMVEVYKDTSLEKKGTNEPIVFQGTIIGVVGISGEPEEVRPFTKLVRTVSLLLVEELNKYQKMEKNRHRKNQFIKDLIAAQGNYSEELKNEGIGFYNLNLLVKQYCYLAKDEATLKKFFPEREIFSFRNCFIVFSEEKRLKQSEFLVVCTPKNDFGQMIKDVWFTYLYIAFFQLEKAQLFETKEYYYAQFFAFPLGIEEDLVKKVKKNYEEYAQTVISFAKFNGNINESAKSLHIHRNTLNYRLGRILAITGKDLRRWDDLWVLVYHFAYCFKEKIDTSTIEE